MKRFVTCDGPDTAVVLGHLAHQCECAIVRLHRSHALRVQFHYQLPEDMAQATLELLCYFTGNHLDGDHMRGRLTEQ